MATTNHEILHAQIAVFVSRQNILGKKKSQLDTEIEEFDTEIENLTRKVDTLKKKIWFKLASEKPGFELKMCNKDMNCLNPNCTFRHTGERSFAERPRFNSRSAVRSSDTSEVQTVVDDAWNS